jgi:hypothetical protein
VDADEQTPAERARILAAVHAMQPVRMRRRSDGFIVAVNPSRYANDPDGYRRRIAERLAAGYQLIEQQGEWQPCHISAATPTTKALRRSSS